MIFKKKRKRELICPKNIRSANILHILKGTNILCILILQKNLKKTLSLKFYLKNLIWVAFWKKKKIEESFGA